MISAKRGSHKTVGHLQGSGVIRNRYIRRHASGGCDRAEEGLDDGADGPAEDLHAVIHEDTDRVGADNAIGRGGVTKGQDLRGGTQGYMARISLCGILGGKGLDFVLRRRAHDSRLAIFVDAADQGAGRGIDRHEVVPFAGDGEIGLEIDGEDQLETHGHWNINGLTSIPDGI